VLNFVFNSLIARIAPTHRKSNRDPVPKPHKQAREVRKGDRNWRGIHFDRREQDDWPHQVFMFSQFGVEIITLSALNLELPLQSGQ